MGARGFELEYSGAVGGFPLSTCSDTGFPLPVSTRTSCAGMTEQGARDLSLLGVGGVPLDSKNSLESLFAKEGLSGSKRRSAGGFRSALSALQLPYAGQVGDLTTTRKTVQGVIPAGGLGVSPNFLFSPQDWGPGG